MAIVGTSLTVKPYTALYTSQVPDAQITVSSSTSQGRTETVLDFTPSPTDVGINTRDFETLFSWPISQGTILFVWQPSIVPFPENIYDRASDWIDLGAAKFVQGYSIMADSFNVPKTFQLQSGDDFSFHPLVEIPVGGTPFAKQTRKVFSCVPFVCHTLRRVASDGVAWRVWEEAPIFAPYPEMQQNWTTELTALGGVGWQHQRYMNFAYLSTAPITLTFSVDSENGSTAPLTKTIPSSGGTQTKLFLQMSPNKWKLIGFSATSTEPFALWLPDIEVAVRSWGDSGPYRPLKPFGGTGTSQAEV